MRPDLAEDEKLRTPADARSFCGAPETTEYVETHYSVRSFDAMHCFEKMAEMERRMRLAIQNMKAAENDRMNAEETSARHRQLLKRDMDFRPMICLD